MTDIPNESPAKPRLDIVPAVSASWSGAPGLFILAGLTIEVAQVIAFPPGLTSLEGWARLAGIGCVAIGLTIQFVRFRQAPPRFEEQRDELGEAAAIEIPTAAETAPEAAQAPAEPAQPSVPRVDAIRAKAGDISTALQPFSATRFDAALAASSGEPADFWWVIKGALVAADWRQVTWTESGDAARYEDRRVPAAVGAKNVEIHLHPESRNKLLPAATALIAALNDAGIAAVDVGFDCANGNVDAIHILIGDRH